MSTNITQLKFKNKNFLSLSFDDKCRCLSRQKLDKSKFISFLCGYMHNLIEWNFEHCTDEKWHCQQLKGLKRVPKVLQKPPQTAQHLKDRLEVWFMDIYSLLDEIKKMAGDGTDYHILRELNNKKIRDEHYGKFAEVIDRLIHEERWDILSDMIINNNS